MSRQAGTIHGNTHGFDVGIQNQLISTMHLILNTTTENPLATTAMITVTDNKRSYDGMIVCHEWSVGYPGHVVIS